MNFLGDYATAKTRLSSKVRRPKASELIMLGLALFSLCACRSLPTPKPPNRERLVLATTTSIEDTGLLASILPDFEGKFGAKVNVVAVGTGQALEMGARGDVDVVLVHDRAREEQFIRERHARERFEVMYNDYILVGPRDDPAKAATFSTAVAALRAIATAQATFVSRGDESGTHAKERSLWASAGIVPTKESSWYKLLGQGMGETLLAANEMRAYTLSDRGTYLAMREKLPNLTVIVGGNTIQENQDEELLNPYGVMAINPDKHPRARYELAMQFIQWLLSPEVQNAIGRFGLEQYGQPLFYPYLKE